MSDAKKNKQEDASARNTTASDPHEDLHGEFSEHPKAVLDGLATTLVMADEIEAAYEELRRMIREFRQVDRELVGHVLLTPRHELTALATAMREMTNDHHAKTCPFCRDETFGI